MSVGPNVLMYFLYSDCQTVPSFLQGVSSRSLFFSLLVGGVEAGGDLTMVGFGEDVKEEGWDTSVFTGRRTKLSVGRT